MFEISEAAVVAAVVVVDKQSGGFKHDEQRRHGIVERERTVVCVYTCTSCMYEGTLFICMCGTHAISHLELPYM